MRDVSHLESYCDECEQWSPEPEWIEDDVEIDGEAVESFVICPRCQRHWPPYDPPIRQRAET